MQVEQQKPLKIVATKEDVVVVDLNNKDIHLLNDPFQFEIGSFPRIVRVYKDRIEIDVNDGFALDGGGKKTTLHFFYTDVIALNRTLFKIHHHSDR
jgi:hypothetical protein